jgi:hypothetical protein
MSYDNLSVSSRTVAAQSVPTASSKSLVARPAWRSKQIRWKRCTKHLQ